MHVRLAVEDVRGPFRVVGLGNRWDLPVLAFGISTHAQVLTLRRSRPRLARGGAGVVAFSLSEQDRPTEVMISELHGWPALPSPPMLTPTALPLSALG